MLSFRSAPTILGLELATASCQVAHWCPDGGRPNSNGDRRLSVSSSRSWSSCSSNGNHEVVVRWRGRGFSCSVASPQFYNFNAAFAYQTLALALGAGAVSTSLVEGGRHRLARVQLRYPALPVACLAGVTVTHHLVSWITVAFLCVWTAILWASGRRQAARVVGTASAAGLVFVVGWTIFNEARLLSYLDPLLSAAFDGLVGVVTGSTAKRELFHTTAATGGTPFWQELVLLGSDLPCPAQRDVAVVCSVPACPEGWRPAAVGLRRRARLPLYRRARVTLFLGKLATWGTRASTFV